MRFIIRKLIRLNQYVRNGVIWQYFYLNIFSGFKVIENNNDKIVIKTKFEKLIYELPYSESQYLYAANPKNELLISTYMNITDGTFIDVGAFIGRHSIRLAKKQNVRVIALEPNPFSLELFKKNALLNNVYEKIEIKQAALIDDDSMDDITMKLDYDRSEIITDSYNHNYKLINVKTITFNKLLREFNINTKNPVLMKIDIEGYEEKVLKSMREFLVNCTNNFKLVCEILSNSPNKLETINYLKSLGFKVLQVDNENYFIHKI